MASNLDKILFTFPSNIGVGRSKADEMILPAVLLPIPGRETHWSILLGQECGSWSLFLPTNSINILCDFILSQAQINN